ncbi:MAG: hypothetical protein OFPI_38800 [Osedax symbiont Rs2]|nr:MAG: hypothetical protein OFPI_38800 [Osedax symbiont Rs2]
MTSHWLENVLDQILPISATVRDDRTKSKNKIQASPNLLSTLGRGAIKSDTAIRQLDQARSVLA